MSTNARPIGLLAALALSACGASLEPTDSGRPDSIMTEIHEGTTVPAGPSEEAGEHSWARTEIDRAAPAEFETATFALG